VEAAMTRLGRGTAKRLIKDLFDHYGVDRSPDHAAEVLVWAVHDGLVITPPRQKKGPGKPATWRGRLGIELLGAVRWEIVKAQDFDKATVAKLRAMPFKERQVAMRELAKCNLSVDAALKRLIEQHPEKWGHNFNRLKQNYYRAKKLFGA
jgi:hypothetical protein